MSVNSSAISTSVIGMNFIAMTFNTEVYAPKKDLLISKVQDKITEKHLDVKLDATLLSRGILTIVVNAASAVGYAVAELIDYIKRSIKASKC